MSSSLVAVPVVSPTAITFRSLAHFMSVVPSPIMRASFGFVWSAFSTACRCSGFGLTCFTLSRVITASNWFLILNLLRM